MTYAVLSDLHTFNWTTFSKTLQDGVNSRLRIILNEWERAADVLVAEQGNRMIVAGDVFHVRGSIDPEVLNPVQRTVQKILDMGISIEAIPGNHDLKGRETTELGSAIQTLAQTFSMEGVFRVYNKPELVFGDDPVAYVPWRSTNEVLLQDIEKLAALAGPDLKDFDLVIHAGIDGVLPNMPTHGLTDVKLTAYGFKRVWAGHFHNRKIMQQGKVVSIGATTHHHWGDIGAKAGFVLVKNDGSLVEYESNAPKFVDITGMSEDDMILIADGNYVRFRGAQMSADDVKEMREFLIKAGALGVSLQAPKPVVNGRSTARPAGGAKTIAESVQTFIDGNTSLPAHIDRDQVKKDAADVLITTQSTHEEA